MADNQTETAHGIPFLMPRYPSLKEDLVGRASVNGQLIAYPKVMRTMTDPPIANQQFCNLSFMLLKEPTKTESGKTVYGYVNFRGTHPTESAAKADGERIIKTVDSKNMVRVGSTGHWLPITEDENNIRDKIDVMTVEDEVSGKPQLRTEAVRQKQEEDMRRARELKEHEEELLKDVNDPTPLDEKEKTLDGYCMKRVTEMKLLEMEVLLLL